MTVKNSPEVHHLTDASSVTSTNAQQPQPQTKALRPKAVSQWTVLDVQKWLRRHCSDLNSVDYFALYAEKFLEQDITGRSLVRLNENSLLRLEIIIPEHRQAILREISKLRLRTNILLLKDMEKKHPLTCSSTSEVHN